MSNEIQYRHDTTAETLYATARSLSNQYWNPSASDPDWETLVPANWTEYAISLTETPSGGYVYVGTFPAAIAAGRYAVDIFEQAASDPAITDTVLSSYWLDWDGSSEVTLSGVDSTSTDAISATKALEIMLAILGGNTTYNSTTRVLTVKGRDGSTTLWTVTISNTVAGTRTSSTKA
jgi:hypothetical protein